MWVIARAALVVELVVIVRVMIERSLSLLYKLSRLLLRVSRVSRSRSFSVLLLMLTKATDRVRPCVMSRKSTGTGSDSETCCCCSHRNRSALAVLPLLLQCTLVSSDRDLTVRRSGHRRKVSEIIIRGRVVSVGVEALHVREGNSSRNGRKLMGGHSRGDARDLISATRALGYDGR